MDSQDLSLSVLVTREEYCEAFAYQMRQQRKKLTVIMVIAGILFFLLGTGAVVFRSMISLSLSAATFMIVIGVFLVCYDALFAPFFNKAAAAKEYDEKEDLHYSTIYVFKGDAVHLRSGRIDGELPLRLMTAWKETPALITFEYGRELNLCIPKRLMTTEQCETLRSILRDNSPVSRQ